MSDNNTDMPEEAMNFMSQHMPKMSSEQIKKMAAMMHQHASKMEAKKHDVSMDDFEKAKK